MFTISGPSDRRCSFQGCGRPLRARGLCSSHLDQLARGKPLTPIRICAGHPNARKDGYVFEHVLMRSQMLGRPLLPREQVHHRNGVKNDNRPENRELWAGHQRKGQPVEDLVNWAREILAADGDLYPVGDREPRDAGVLPSDCRRPQGSARQSPP